MPVLKTYFDFLEWLLTKLMTEWLEVDLSVHSTAGNNAFLSIILER